MPASQKAASRRIRTKTKVIEFRFHAPQAEAMYVAGTFNDWDPTSAPMAKDRDGNWSAVVHLPPGQYEYLFVVDDCWVTDPERVQHVPNPYGTLNSVLEV